MGAAHTPGPWIKTAERSISAADNTRIANVVRMEGVEFYEAEANARLIAATPDLLQSLRELHAVCLGMDLENQMERPTEAEYQAAIAQAAAAIASATGAA